VFDLDAENPVADVDWVPVWAEAGATAHAMAIRITRAASVDHVLFAEPATPVSSTTANSAVERAVTWRACELETDARMLFCRTTANQTVARLGLVDGSMVRVAGRRDFQLALPCIVPAFAADYETEDRARTSGRARTKDVGLGTKDHKTCVVSPVS
jgi:hypothetical protein